MAGGGLMQLVAYGAQDVYLTGNPQITFFKVVYRRHTNFATEAIEQTMNGNVATNGRTTVTVARNGDLVGRVYIQEKLATNVGVNDPVAELDNVELEIGGQLIDRHYGHWMETWYELTENKTGRGLGTLFQEMSGCGQGVDASNNGTAITNSDTDTDVVFFRASDMDSQTVYVPLTFSFCRNPGLAIPLIALQYHEVKLNFKWSTIVSSEHKVFCDYHYLDTDERRRFAQVSHEYLIEQVQFQNSASTTSHELNFNHPVKELVWTGGWSGGQIAALGGLAHTVTLKLNGHDRFAARPMTYFSRTQVYQHHSGEGGLVDNSIAVYSFALKPEEHQPSGTCNFSRIDNARLNLSNADALFVYAVNYNVLRIMSGMGGLAYSN